MVHFLHITLGLESIAMHIIPPATFFTSVQQVSVYLKELQSPIKNCNKSILAILAASKLDIPIPVHIICTCKICHLSSGYFVSSNHRYGHLKPAMRFWDFCAVDNPTCNSLSHERTVMTLCNAHWRQDAWRLLAPMTQIFKSPWNSPMT